MIQLINFLRSAAILIRPNSDGGAVRIGPRYHQHIVTLQTMEAGVDICR